MNRTETVILSALSVKAGTARTISITHGDLSALTSVPVGTVRRAVRALTVSGHLTRLTNGRDGKPSVYRIGDESMPGKVPSRMLPDGCDPACPLERYVHRCLDKAGIPHLYDVPYRLIDPRWEGEHRCDFLVGLRYAIEIGKTLPGTDYSQVRQAKRAQADRLGIRIVEIAKFEFARNAIPNLWMGFGGNEPEEIEPRLARLSDFPSPSLPAFFSAVRASVRQHRVEVSPLPRSVRPEPTATPAPAPCAGLAFWWEKPTATPAPEPESKPYVRPARIVVSTRWGIETIDFDELFEPQPPPWLPDEILTEDPDESWNGEGDATEEQILMMDCCASDDANGNGC